MNSIVKKLSSVGKVVSAIIVCGCAVNAMAATLTSKSYMDGETVYHTTNGVVVMSGWTLPEGTTVRLSAQGDKEFLRWIGDVPEGVDATSREIDVTLGTENLQLTPLYNKMWVVDNLAIKSGNTQTGMIYCVERGVTNWSMRVLVSDQSKKTLHIGWDDNLDLITSIEGELDLSTPIIDTDGNSWIITKLRQKCFVRSDNEPTLTTSIIVPKTLTAIDTQAFHDTTFSVLTNLVVDCPEATEGPGVATFNSCSKLKALTLKLPKVTSISEASFPSGTMAGIDVSEWDLSSVTKFTGRSWLTWKPHGFDGKEFTGTIRLPKMQTFMTNDFANTKNLLAAEVGTQGNTLKDLGYNTFGGTCGIKSITIGGAEGWIAKTNSVTFKNGLAQIIFLSTPPTILDGGTFVNETDTEALSVCFYIPKDNQAAWGEVTSKIVRAATPEEIATFCDAHPGAEPPVSVVDVGTLGTKHQQFLGWSVPATTKVVCEVGDPRFGGSVEISPKQYFKPGEEVTLTAHPADGTTFTRWTGLPTGVTNCYDSTITFKVGDKPLEITMWAGPDWTYIAEENLLSNKVWRLNAYQNSDSTLCLGSTTKFAYTGYGEGVLDLNGIVRDADDPNKTWTITKIDTAFNLNLIPETIKLAASINPWTEPVTTLVLPRTLKTTNGQWMHRQYKPSNMNAIILDAPEWVGALADWLTTARQGVRIIALNLPGITSISRQAKESFTLSAEGANIDMWNLSGLKTLKTNGLRLDTIQSGTLHLESITTLEEMALPSKGVTGYEFGTGYDKKSNAKLTLGNGAISNNYNLASIKFGPYSEISVADDTAFAKCTALRKIVFEGKPIAMNVIDNLLCEAASLTEQIEPVVIYASKALGWDKIERFVAFNDLSEEEQALKPVELDDPTAEVIGAFKCSDESKRAWIVNYRSRFDPDGTVFIIR